MECPRATRTPHEARSKHDKTEHEASAIHPTAPTPEAPSSQVRTRRHGRVARCRPVRAVADGAGPFRPRRARPSGLRVFAGDGAGRIARALLRAGRNLPLRGRSVARPPPARGPADAPALHEQHGQQEDDADEVERRATPRPSRSSRGRWHRLSIVPRTSAARGRSRCCCPVPNPRQHRVRKAERGGTVEWLDATPPGSYGCEQSDLAPPLLPNRLGVSCWEPLLVVHLGPFPVWSIGSRWVGMHGCHGDRPIEALTLSLR